YRDAVHGTTNRDCREEVVVSCYFNAKPRKVWIESLESDVVEGISASDLDAASATHFESLVADRARAGQGYASVVVYMHMICRRETGIVQRDAGIGRY